MRLYRLKVTIRGDKLYEPQVKMHKFADWRYLLMVDNKVEGSGNISTIITSSETAWGYRRREDAMELIHQYKLQVNDRQYLAGNEYEYL